MNDDYIFDTKKVQFKTATANGITYTTTGVVGKDGEVVGDLSCKSKVSGAQMTTKLLTSGMVTQEMVLDNTGVQGLKLTVLGGLGQNHSLEATGEYVHPHVSALVKANCLQTPWVQSSLAVGLHGVTAGVEAKVDVEKKKVEYVDGVINYSKSSEHEATVMVLSNATTAKFMYSHEVSPDLSVAGEFRYDMANDDKTLTMASKFDVDEDLTLKSKITSNGDLSLCLVQKIRKNTTLTLCSRFDVSKLETPLDRFGLSLVLE